MSDRDFLSDGSMIASAVAFLSQWYEDAPRQLVSIVPDGAIASKCLWPQNPVEIRDWLSREVAAGKNVYFHVNQPGWALDKRAEKKDIRTVRALHVDIDPDAGESPEAAKTRARAALAKHEPPPSVVIDSGNGLQAFWLLEEHVTLNGAEEDWERIEAYNIALANGLGGDRCYNIDRIMRLPGTINVPNKKKVAKGRVSVPAVLLPELTTWERYPLSAFTPAPLHQRRRSTLARCGRVAIPDSLARYPSPDDIPVKLDDYTKVLIVNGHDPEDPNKYPSRSEVLWRVLCDMVRADATDETMAAVITDRGFNISASVLDKRNPLEYAADQIAKARDAVVHPDLAELNAKHAVIENAGGKCLVLEEVFDELLNRQHPVLQSFDAFRCRYMNRSVEVPTKNGSTFRPLGEWWLKHERRRQYLKIVFSPNGPVPSEHYNLWRGFPVEARPGNLHEPFLQLLRDVVCDGHEARYKYLLGWMARAVQHPELLGEVAVVLRGKKGTGKSFSAQAFGSLFGQHFVQVNSPKMVVGDFNGHLRGCLVLFADEAFHVGDKQHEGVLKGLITEPTRMVEAKGLDAELTGNYLHVIMASNDDWVVPASVDERRFFVLDVSDARMRDTDYFRGLHLDLAAGGRENLLHFLLNYDLRDFEVRDVPNTPGLNAQRIASLPPEAQALLDILNDAVLPNNAADVANVAATMDWEACSGQPRLLGLLNYARIRVPAMKSVSEKKFAQALKSIGCVHTRLTRHGYRNGWIFPPLKDARAAFERAYGEYPWGVEAEDWYPARSIYEDPF